jgi:hypothetical protein
VQVHLVTVTLQAGHHATCEQQSKKQQLLRIIISQVHYCDTTTTPGNYQHHA